jgi:hypothetical protein
MKKILTCLLFSGFTLVSTAQKILTAPTKDGNITLSKDGASYFAKLSLECTNKPYPHYYMEQLQKAEDLKPPEKMWPSFYGCYDWHSGVHNHWALVKLLKSFPNIPEAKAIRQKLELSFNAKNILEEVAYLQSHEERDFEFPYGTSWLLKVADELLTWNDPIAKTWVKNLEPLTKYITQRYIFIWPLIKKATYTGDHYSSALGLAFALDYARTSKNDSLEIVVVEAAKKYYTQVKDFPLVKEPFGYDFMSAGLLITDLMSRVLPPTEYESWLKSFSKDLFTEEGIKKVLYVQRIEEHAGFESHWDGFHLNRIWCINKMIKSLPTAGLEPNIKSAWQASQKEMWNYAQESIGKGNYDIDHWLSSFSVFALIGYENILLQ